ncbi:GH36 C-terminal domain-containing protein [Pseudalkalibacillus decolorationis]|uniref:GH36 C-terminal domain-containing protein n=1 Tax=Pseudalkalibacillus decolorationis TaxID=163879 RepID=UPI00355876AC
MDRRFRFVKLKLKGLEPDTVYMCESLQLTASGQYFMENGFIWEIKNDFDSALFQLNRIQG